ncbi:MAG: hypothetical protein HQL24_06015, partial [Candidatus Omnitrophica bacterium]|nr:hypothetical protein [Candidatus Omnitrophota bacterium]
VGIGTTTNNIGLSVSSSSAQAALNVKSNGAQGLFQDKSGNVGVGITNPAAVLDVNGNLYVESANGRIWGINGLASGHTVHFQYGGDANNTIDNTFGGQAIFRAYWGTQFYDNQGEIARIGTTSNSLNSYFLGNVGIGTTTITNKLQVVGSVAIGTTAFNVTAPTTGLLVEGNVGIGTTTNNIDLAISSSSGQASFSAKSNGVQGLFQDASGNVGIGSTVPAGKLQVVGGDVLVGTGSFNNAGASDDLYVTGNIEFDGLIYGNGSQLTNLSAGGWTDGGTNMYNTTLTDKVGIGTSAPLNNLQVVSSVGIGTTEYNVAAPSNGMIVQGNVGIGTSGVTNKLDVNGAIAVGTYASSAVRTAPTSGMAISGNVGIGTATATNNLQVVGAVAIGTSAFNVSAPTTGLLVEGNVGIGTTTNNIGLSVSSGSSQAALNIKSNGAQGLFQDKSGNVGIGSTVPAGKLQTVGGDVLVGTGSFNNAGASDDLYVTGNLEVDGAIYGDGSNLTNLSAGGWTKSGTNIYPTTVTNTVGIGTSAPTNNLQIVGAVGIGTTEYNVSAPTTGMIVKGNVGIGTSGVTNKLDVNGAIAVGTYASSAVRTAPTSGMAISGNVGIGTATATNNLQVVGAVAIGTSAFNVTAPTTGLLVEGNVGIGTTTNNIGLSVSSSSGQSALNVKSNGVQGLFQGNDGDVGIGTTGVTNKLDVNGAIAVGTYASSAVRTAPTSGMAISGNVGIGTATATNNLQVVGAVAIGTSAFNVSAPTTGLLVEGNVGIGTTTNNIGLSVSSSSGQSALNVKSNGVQGLFQGNDGDVGIGTTVPAGKLQVVGGDVLVGTGSFGNGGSSDDLYVTGNIEFDGLIYGNGSQLTNLSAGGWTDGGTTVYNTTLSDKVGIGTSAPLNNLQVVSTVGIGTTEYNVAAPTNGMIVKGNVGIGTSGVTNKLDINGAVAIGTYASSAIRTAPTSGMAISGNVGIGTATATNNLQVVGAVGIGSSAFNVSAPTTGLLVEGNVGIGTTTNNIGLSISSSSGQDALSVKSNGVQGLLQDESGRVAVSNGANPTLSAAGQISVDTSATTGSMLRFYGDAQYSLPAYKSKSFTITSVTATSDYALWRAPYAITVRAWYGVEKSGTNVIGYLDLCDSNASSCTALGGAGDVTIATTTSSTTGLSVSVAAGNYIGWHTTSVSGTNDYLSVTFDYTVDAAN